MNTWALPGYTESFVLGSGASGRVVLAVHEETGVPVAVKYLSESLCTRPGFVRDFRAEARLLGGLESPFVTELYEYVESPDGAAIVMELVDGVSLRAVLRREAELGPEAALVILKGSLLGLADAHRVGVVHRDYKPENVLVAPDGSSKLVDFGIAVDAGTRAGVAGTPSYMAPEQWTGAPASPAADVYAAAATFFECLTGHKPYRGDNMAALALQHVDAPVPADEVPEAVRELVRRGLAKDPEERPAQAEEFVGELEAAALAGYGPDWEERGRGRLAALVALLPLLLPSAHGDPRTTTDTARTVLRQEPGRGGAQAWLPGPSGMLVSGAALLLGAVLTFGLQHAPGADTGQVAQALATTSAEGSTQTAAPPAPTDSASASSSPTPTDSASESSSPTPSPSDTALTPTGEPSSTVTTDGSTVTTEPGGATTTPPPTTTSPAPVTAPAVKDVSVSGFRQTGPATATATIDVVTDGTGPISLTVSWSVGDAPGRFGTPDGVSQTFERSGATRYTLTVDHTFRGTGCYWSVQATTTPTAADGGASQQLLTRRCVIG
ncbi:serine/threonine-protein kinase [Streptomyces griseiscabiei]|uniref:non-specific serine/threonine protein kinase n=2 Tax=Streptomyces griseiscabiei TaxID=2993540 RepID=A0ABU4LCS7_9ACTN|nr:serine/threonine-protein kinase [Streptomyces griseiscabiei]MBZ3900223.1 serine/threonine protein kinase [Streptomyces griseiscabiei]MDX2913231.1 serine/threonine protein kinase [Streptomyces griseiscabiei]